VQQQSVYINLEGQTFGRDQLVNLVAQLKQYKGGTGVGGLSNRGWGVGLVQCAFNPERLRH